MLLIRLADIINKDNNNSQVSKIAITTLVRPIFRGRK